MLNIIQEPKDSILPAQSATETNIAMSPEQPKSNGLSYTSSHSMTDSDEDAHGADEDSARRADVDTQMDGVHETSINEGSAEGWSLEIINANS